MQQHLDLPCEKCLDTVGFWQAVKARALKEIAPRPPEKTVNQAKALFGLLKHSESRPWHSAWPSAFLIALSSPVRQASATLQ
jgi:hypothetical protein